MLQFIRERVTGIVAIFVLGLLAIPFLFFGVESYIRTVPQDAVATVGDEEITVSEFQTSFAQYRTRMREQLGDDYDELAINQPAVRREHLESMIEQELLRQFAERMGLDVAPDTLREIIQGIPAFQVADRFDPDRYRQWLQATGRSPRAFERDLRADLLVRELPTTLSASVIVTESEVDRLLRVQLENRTIALVEVPAADFRESVEVTDQDVEAFYAENQSEFMVPERVSLEYVELDTREMVRAEEVQEEELRSRYEAAKARYMTPERRHAAHILITTDEGEQEADTARELAWSLYQRIEEGEDFADLAREYSEDPGSSADGGDLGWIEPGVMETEFEEALFELAPGEVTEPVETSFGWHLIRLEAIDEPRGQDFAEARQEILEEFLEEQATDLFYELSERVVDLVYADPTTLEPVAAELGLEIRTTGPFSRFGGEGIAADPRVQEAAFSDLVLVDGHASEPLELGRNHLVVVRRHEHFPAHPRSLEDVAEEIRERLIRERAQEQARERAAAVAEQAGTAGAALEDTAAEYGYEMLVLESVSRRDFELGGQFLTELFRLPAPGDEPAVHILPKGGNWAVIRLEAVIPGDPDAADQAQRLSARQVLEMAYMGHELDGLIAWLRENTTIRVVGDRLM